MKCKKLKWLFVVVLGAATFGEATAIPINEALDNNLVWVSNQSNAVGIQTDAAVNSNDCIQMECREGPNFIETILEGPGVLEFQWKQLSKYGPRLALEINGKVQFVGEQALDKWDVIKVELAAGTHTVRWHFDSDSFLRTHLYSTSLGTLGYIDDVQWVPTQTLPVMDGLDNVPTQLVIIRDGNSPWYIQTQDSHDGIDSVTSIGVHSSSSEIIIPQIEGPGTLQFYWKAGPHLKLQLKNPIGSLRTLDNRDVNASTGWDRVELPLTAGFHDIIINSWNWSNQDSGSRNAIDQLSVLPPLSIAQGLDMENGLPLQTGGNISWSGISYTGAFRGNDMIQTNSEATVGEAWVETTVTGPGLLEFAWLSSYEIEFLINELKFIESPKPANLWEDVSVYLPNGSHSLRWTYTKPDSASIYRASPGYLDAVRWNPNAKSLGDALDLPSDSAYSTGPSAWHVHQGEGFNDNDAAACYLDFTDWEQPHSVLNIPYLQGPGSLKLRWKIGPNHALSLWIDGQQVERVFSQSGSDWMEAETILKPGTQTLSIHCETIGERQPGMPPSLVDAVVIADPIELTMGLDTNDSLTFTTGGDQPWKGIEWQDAFDAEDCVVSGVGPDGTTSWLETSMEGPGTLSFAWFNPLGGLSLLINDKLEITSISEKSEWEQVSRTLGPGKHTIRWLFIQRNANATFGRITGGYVDAVQWTATPTPMLKDALDSTPSELLTRGDEIWHYQTSITKDGTDALALILPEPNTRSALHLPAVQGPGVLRYSWKAGNNQTLALYVNGQYSEEIRADVLGESSPWQDVEYILESGLHAIEFRTERDFRQTPSPQPSVLDVMALFPPIPLSEGLDISEPTSVSTGGASPWQGIQYNASNDGMDAAQSGLLKQGEVSWIETTFTGPGTLSFAWLDALKSDWDFHYTVNGEAIELPPNDGNWKTFLQVFADGHYTARWSVVAKNSTPSNYVLMDQLNWKPDSTPALWTAIGSPSLQIVSYGDKPWYAKGHASFSGGSAAVADDVLYETQSLEFRKVEGPGSMIIDMREAEGKDLYVFINQYNLLDSVNPDLPVPVFLPPGLNTVRIDSFAYSPASINSSHNAVDTVRIQAPIQLETALDTDGSLQLTTGGDTGWFGLEWPPATDSQDAALTGLFDRDDTETWVETSIEGPGTLQFQWAREGTYNNLELLMEIDGERFLRQSLMDKWTSVQQALPKGSFTIRWSLRRLHPSNTRSIALMDTVRFNPKPVADLIEALDTAPGLPLTYGEQSIWKMTTSESHDGQDALYASPPLNGYSSVSIPNVKGPGMLRFYVKTGAQHRFYLSVNNLEVGYSNNESGSPTDWELVEFPLGVGAHDINLTVVNFGQTSASASSTIVDELALLSDFSEWAHKQGYGTDPNSDSDADSIPLLAEYAFNLSPEQFDRNTLLQNPRRGLPASQATWLDGYPALGIEFLQRKNDPNVVYVPEFSEFPDFRTILPAETTSAVFIDGTWNRVLAIRKTWGSELYARVRVSFYRSEL